MVACAGDSVRTRLVVAIMKLVDRYIIKTVFGSLALVLFILTGLEAFLLFVSQLGDLGKADYGTLQALVFVGLQLPYQIYLFFPMASLLGCLVGLGVMASQHELVVLRAAGMSMGQITLAVFKMAVCLILVMTVLGEMVLPKLMLRSHNYKVQALHGGKILQTSKGRLSNFILINNGDCYLCGEFKKPHKKKANGAHLLGSKQIYSKRGRP